MTKASNKGTKKHPHGRKRGEPSAASPGDNSREGDELRPEYESELIRRGVRGKYSDRYAAGTNVVVLEPDVAAAFPDATAVNRALRALLEIARRQIRGKLPAA